LKYGRTSPEALNRYWPPSTSERIDPNMVDF
jgi:hypothetical protein